MKAILEFDMPADEDNFKLAAKATLMHMHLIELSNSLRGHFKHDLPAPTLEEIQSGVDRLLGDLEL